MHVVAVPHQQGKYMFEEDQYEPLLYAEKDHETPRMEEARQAWLKILERKRHSRRTLALEPDAVKVFIHFDIDLDMVNDMTEIGAVQYIIELVSWISDNLYGPLGFELSVRSVTIREERIAAEESTSAYLDAVMGNLPSDCHLFKSIHELITHSCPGKIEMMCT